MSEGPFGFVPPGADPSDRTMPRFYMRLVPNAFRSKNEGRPVFEEVEYVEILIPGNRHSTPDERVKDEHRERWPVQYKRFKDGLEMATEGWPLEEWSAMPRGLVEELKHFHIRTVEALAALDDGGLQKACPMGGFGWREKAKRALEQAQGAEPMERLAAESEAQRATMATMEETIKAMAAEVERLKKKGADVQ